MVRGEGGGRGWWFRLHCGLCGTTLSSVAMTVAHAVVVEAACRSTVRQPPALSPSLSLFIAPSLSLCGAGFEIYLGSFSLSLYLRTRYFFVLAAFLANAKIPK